MNKTVSILLPTKERQKLCKQSIDSLYATVKDPDNMEILVAYDFDSDVDDLIVIHKDNPNIHFIKCKPFGYSCLHMYYNKLASLSSGDWLFIWNDDCLMATSGWDSIIYNHENIMLAPIPPAIKNKSKSRNKDKVLFPIVNKEWFNVTGRLSGHSATDTWIEWVALKSGLFKRVDIVINHSRPKDETAKNAFVNTPFISNKVQKDLQKDVDVLLRWKEKNIF